MEKTTQTRLGDLYESITNRIIVDLEQGVRPWTKPWSTGHTEGRITRPLRHSGEPYSGINVLLLWSEAISRGYVNATWMTFRQALALGAHVRKGETGSLVVYADSIKRTETNDAGEDVDRTIPFLKSYTVFNVEQIEGLPKSRYSTAPEILDPIERIEVCDRFFSATGVEIRLGGGSAYYGMHSDHVQMPPIEVFKDATGYYATLAHEVTHATRHPSRLDRDFGRKSWGDEGYAREELVAELGAAFLCADLGLELEPREDHASYIASWLKALRNDKRCIFSAAAHAQRAVEWIATAAADRGSA